MSLLNNKDKGGNSSKFSWNHSVLKGLQSISDGTQGLATEGTLISVLNAIVASDQDIEVLLVRDEAVGNGDPVLKQVTNYETGVPVITYENVDGTPYVPAPNPVPVYVYLDPSAVLNLILAELLDQGVSLDAIVTSTGLSATEVTLALANSNIVLGNITLNALLNETGLAPNSAVVERLNSAGATNFTCAAANPLRRALKVTNNSESPIYLKEGSVATSTSFTWIIEEAETVIIDDYNGQVDGTWLGVVTAAGTAALITETTF